MDCSKCIFAITTPPASGGPFGVWQCGCKVDRLSKLIEREEAHLPEPSLEGEMVNFYKLDRFCNMYRTSKWKRETKPNNIQKYAKEEIKCSFAIVIDIANQNEEEISKTSRSILGMCYERENIRIIFSSSSQQVDTQTLINEVHHFNELGMKSELVIHSPQSTQTEKDKDAFTTPMQNKSSFLIKLRAGQTLEENFFNFIDMDVNELLNMSTCFADTENNVVALAFGVVNSQYPNFLDYDLMLKEIINLSIDQKSYREYEKKY